MYVQSSNYTITKEYIVAKRINWLDQGWPRFWLAT